MRWHLWRWIMIVALGWLVKGSGTAQVLLPRATQSEQLSFLLHDSLPVTITRLPENINTPFSEYNALLLPDSSFYFSSLRLESGEDFSQIFDPFWSTQLYRSQLTIGGYAKPQPMSATINDPNYYNCNFTFNRDQSLVIFARCERSQEKQLRCNLWQSEAVKGRWQKPQLLNRRINLPGTTTTQPHWVDGDRYSVLYFVSDRPHGFGDLDIWYTIYHDGRFDDPINAGSAINSPDNEVTPFYDPRTQRLYFSSDNPATTIGGYDIFYAIGSLSQWSAPTNMGVPLNSAANDMYFTVNAHNSDGFFASNRPKTPDAAADTCCTDLYSYHWCYPADSVAQDSVLAAATDTVQVGERARRLLPISLYFHNDEPDPRSTATTTRQNYQQTLADYIALKEIYQNEYARGLKGEAAANARQRIERFFADSVAQGFRRLEEFTQMLLADLQAGNTVTITVCGFASPLHKADYNVALSARRIVSFINYLRTYGEGVLQPYLNGSARNQLIVISEPAGAAQARKEVSNNINDIRNSVYSIAASKERRIQITTYEVVSSNNTNNHKQQ